MTEAPAFTVEGTQVLSAGDILDRAISDARQQRDRLRTFEPEGDIALEIMEGLLRRLEHLYD